MQCSNESMVHRHRTPLADSSGLFFMTDTKCWSAESAIASSSIVTVLARSCQRSQSQVVWLLCFHKSERKQHNAPAGR
jgi:hypothetical protein